jgi:hypothetical protein
MAFKKLFCFFFLLFNSLSYGKPVVFPFKVELTSSLPFVKIGSELFLIPNNTQANDILVTKFNLRTKRKTSYLLSIKDTSEFTSINIDANRLVLNEFQKTHFYQLINGKYNFIYTYNHDLPFQDIKLIDSYLVGFREYHSLGTSRISYGYITYNINTRHVDYSQEYRYSFKNMNYQHFNHQWQCIIKENRKNYVAFCDPEKPVIYLKSLMNNQLLDSVQLLDTLGLKLKNDSLYKATAYMNVKAKIIFYRNYENNINRIKRIWSDSNSIYCYTIERDRKDSSNNGKPYLFQLSIINGKFKNIINKSLITKQNKKNYLDFPFTYQKTLYDFKFIAKRKNIFGQLKDIDYKFQGQINFYYQLNDFEY